MEYPNDEKIVVVGLCLIILAGFCGCLKGDYLGANRVRAEAIKAGVAKWTVNAENGETKFEWIRGEK